MIFIAVALVAAVGIALILSGDAGTLFGLGQMQAGQLIALVVILVFICAGLFSRRYRASQLITNLGLWAGIFGIVMIGYTYRDDLSGIAARVFGELVPGNAIVDTVHGTATFRSGPDGHFQINAKVNGKSVRTIFDTGASAVVLTAEDARRAGIDTRNLDYSVPVQTANGIGRAAVVTVDEIDVGGITRNNVRAFVAERGALDTSLLGMSFLKTLSRYSVSSNSLELSD